MDVAEAQPQLKDYLKYVKIAHVPVSDLPYRIETRRCGQILGSFESRGKPEVFLLSYDINRLNRKPTRKSNR